MVRRLSIASQTNSPLDRPSPSSFSPSDFSSSASFACALPNTTARRMIVEQAKFELVQFEGRKEERLNVRRHKPSATNCTRRSFKKNFQNMLISPAWRTNFPLISHTPRDEMIRCALISSTEVSRYNLCTHDVWCRCRALARLVLATTTRNSHPSESARKDCCACLYVGLSIGPSPLHFCPPPSLLVPLCQVSTC
jgi:hypothetical protein